MKRPNCFYILFYDSWYWKLIGFIGAVIVLIVAAIALYFPVIKPNLEQHNSIVSRIEQRDADYSYGDISEFSTHSNAYLQAQEYDGKIIEFTGCVSTIRGSIDGEYGESVISIDSITLDEWCANCEVNNLTKAELEQILHDGDKVTIIGEVYRSDWVIVLRNCKVELCEN